MNTFLPRGRNYLAGCRELDRVRQQKQLVEVQQMHTALVTGLPVPILHHPATQMWRGLEQELLDYGLDCYEAWLERFPGRSHKSGEYICAHRVLGRENIVPWFVDVLMPYHQARLYVKDPYYYQHYADSDAALALSYYPVTGERQEDVGRVFRADGARRWSISASAQTFPTAWAGVRNLRGRAACNW